MIVMKKNSFINIAISNQSSWQWLSMAWTQLDKLSSYPSVFHSSLPFILLFAVSLNLYHPWGLFPLHSREQRSCLEILLMSKGVEFTSEINFAFQFSWINKISTNNILGWFNQLLCLRDLVRLTEINIWRRWGKWKKIIKW